VKKQHFLICILIAIMLMLTACGEYTTAGGSAADTATTQEIANRIQSEMGIEPRVTVLGHIQRGGSPTSRDREMASRMGYEAVHALLATKGNRVIVSQDGSIVDMDMEAALAMVKPFDMTPYSVLESLTNSDR